MFARTINTRWIPIAVVSAAALTAALLPLGADAQNVTSARVVFTPYAGIYSPIGTLRADSTVEFNQLMTLMIGVRTSVQIARRFAVEATTGWTPTPSWVAQSDWQQTVDVPGRVATVSLRARYDLNPNVEAGDWVVGLASGVGVVKRHGQAWEGLTGTTDIAFVFGATSRLRPITSRLSYGLDFDGFITRAEFGDYLGQRTRARLHADVVCSLALSFSL